MRLFSIAAVLALCVLACGGDDDDDSANNGGTGGGADQCDDAPTFSEVTAFSQVCVNCHSSTLTGNDRNGAPEGYNFDQYESASDEAEEIEELVRSGEMPPSNSGYSISEAQKSALYLWIECDTPE
jgi:uncharacterized membrane protein